MNNDDPVSQAALSTATWSVTAPTPTLSTNFDDKPATGTTSSSSSSSPATAEDRYVLGPRLGQGGMGRVLSAWDRRLGRDIAFKEVLEPTPRTEAMLLQEATLTATLDHPGIVPIYDVGRTSDGRLYYTMRLVRGRTLRDVARATLLSPTGAMTSTTMTLTLVRHALDAARAVAFAHDRGVVHRDLKPDNILVGSLGEVQVADWGLALRLHDASDVNSDVNSNVNSDPGDLSSAVVIGTVGYLAPELASGAGASRRTDVFSLGCILRELLPPSSSSSSSSLAFSALNAIVARACDADPARRYVDARAFAQDLQAFFDDGVVEAHREGIAHRLRRLGRRHRTLSAAISVAVAVAGVVGAAAVVRVVHERDRALLAERHTSEALADALVVQARAALHANAGHDARGFAHAAIALGAVGEALLDAHGVLAALQPVVGSGPRRRELATVDDVGCDAVFVADTASDMFVCRVAGSTRWRTVAAPTVDVGRVNIAAAAVAFDTQRAVVVVRALDDRLHRIDLRSGVSTPVGIAVAAETSLAVDVGSGQFVSSNRALLISGRLDRSPPVSLLACGRGDNDNVVQGAFFVAGALRVLCADGRIESAAIGDKAMHTVWPAPLAVDDAALLRRGVTAIVDNDGVDSFVVGTVSGEVFRYRADIGRVQLLFSDSDRGTITQLQRTSASSVVVVGSSGAPITLNLDTGAVSGDFGVDDRAVIGVVAHDDLLIFGRTHLTRLTGAQTAPRQVQLPVGLNSVDLATDVVAVVAVVAGSAGYVARVWLDSGRVVALNSGLGMNVKQAVLRTGVDGRTAIVTGGVDNRGPVMWPLTDDLSSARFGNDEGLDLTSGVTLRRLGVLADGSVWGLGYSEGPWWWTRSTTSTTLDVPTAAIAVEAHPLGSFVDGRTLPGGGGLIGLDSSGDVIVSGPDSLRVLLHKDGAKQVAASVVGADVDVADTIDRVYLDDGHSVVEHDRAAVGRTFELTGELANDRVTDLAVDDDGRFLVAGTLQGFVVVWSLDDGRAVLRVRQHDAQVGALVVSRRDGRVVVVSVGWDQRMATLAFDM